ncbi:armadillo-type protein [Mycena latifolia]|nr:armadillo-type protein [Mycena latifolia]
MSPILRHWNYISHKRKFRVHMIMEPVVTGARPHTVPVPTQDDSTKAGKEAIERSQAVEITQASTDLWSLYLEEANRRAKAKAKLWNGSLAAFLLFAGLFAGVVSSFVIDSRAGLQPNASANLPSNSSNTNSVGTKVPVSTLAINLLWFTSLTFTLISALAAVLAQTWIVKFNLVPTKGFKGAKERWIHEDKAEHWHLHTAITWITVLIQLSLFLFLAGFAVQAVADHKILGWTILSFVGATLVLYIGITVLPWFYPTTPFQTPFSELSARYQNFFFSDASNLDPATKAKNRMRDIWKFIKSIWTNLGKIPDDAEARLGICWSILKNSSKNDSIHAAVLDLTNKRITPEQSQQLIEYGLPGELLYRLAHLPAGQDKAAVERMKNYLHVIMWMVDECDVAIAQGFSPLLDCEDALLLTLDALPPECRALAFAIRVHLLVNMCAQGKIHGTDWTAMIDSLEPDFALDVFRAAIRGLGIDAKPEVSHLRQDCARMLAAYIGSARFSNERLVASRITGDPLRIPRTQQEPVEQITTFFSQLVHSVSGHKHSEEAWKRSMCTRAIRLMEEVRIDRQIMGFQVLSSVAQNETFREAVNDVLPELGSTLKKVDWKTSVDCLGRLSEMYKQGTFREAIRGIFPNIINLLSDSGEQVRSAVLQLADQIGTETPVVEEIDRISRNLMKDLGSSSWLIRVARLQSLAGIIKIDKISTDVIIGQARCIVACTSFSDKDVRLAAIRTLQELAKHATVEFLAELAGKALFKPVINRSIPAIVTDNFKPEPWIVRRDRLRALGKIISSAQSYDNGIQNAFRDMPDWLSDPDEGVRQTALDIVSLAAGKAALKETISGAITDVLLAPNSSSRTQIAALDTLSNLAKTDTFLDDLTNAIPDIAKYFKAEDEDVRVAALTTCSEIAKIPRATLQNAVNDIMAKILSAQNSTSGRQTQIAALKTLSTVAEIDGLSETVNDDALDKIISGLSDDNSRVRAQVLDTLKGLASKARFHSKIKAAVRDILPMLEDWSWTVRQKALQAFAVFAQQGIFLVSDNEIAPHIISMLSEGDIETSTSVLNILSIAAKQVVAPVIQLPISVVTNSLSHQNWRVRVAGLQFLESLADAKIVDCLSDNFEEVQLAGLRTLFKLIDNEIFRTVLESVPAVLSSLLESESEDHRISVIDIISSYITKNRFCTISDAFVKAIRHIPILLSDRHAAVRMAALRIVPVISKHDVFDEIITDSLEALLKATTRKEDTVGTIEEFDDLFHTEVLKTLFDLARNEKFREKIDTELSGSYPTAASDGSWPARVALLKLMSILGAKARGLQRFGMHSSATEYRDPDAMKNAVKRLLPDINDTLHDNENSEVRMAGVQLLSISVVKEIAPSDFNSLVPTLVTLLSDPEEEVRIAALQTLSDLAKQDVFREAISGKLPALLEALKREESKTRVAALKTWAALAQDADPDDDVRTAALDTLSQLSKRGASNSIYVLGEWWAVTDAFEDIISSALPKIVKSLKNDDDDDEVRIESAKLLLSLVQQNLYQALVRGALQASGISTLVDLTSHGYWRVRIAVLPLIPKVIELGRPPAGDVMSSIVKLLTDDDEEVCIAALEAIGALVAQDVAYAKELTPEIPKLTQLLRSDDSESRMRTTVLLTLSIMVTQVFKDIKEQEFWDAAARVFLALARLVLSIFTEVAAEIPKFEVDHYKPSVLELLDSVDLDVRLPAIRVAVSFNALEPKAKDKLHATIRKTWCDVLTDIKSTNPSVVAYKKLGQLADHVDVFVDEQFTDVIPPIVASLKDERQGIAVSCKFQTGFVKHWCKSYQD